VRVEYLSHDCLIGDDHLDGLTHPVVVDAQRAAAVRKRWSASMPRSQSSSRRSDLLPENLTYVRTFQSVKALSEAELQTKKRSGSGR
jgi:hypothetical protein